MSQRRSGQISLGVAALLCSQVARADTPAPPPTWSQESEQGVAESRESPELRMLRLAEQELFGSGSAEAPEVYDPDCVYGVPDALSSDAPPARIERADGKSEDLAFLKDLKLPSLPVRWDARVIDYLLFFKHDKRGRDLARAWLKRQERYGPMIRRVLREHSLPEDIQFVAMVESGYDPTAKSLAQALGLWQFVKQTGQFYGLRVDAWVDERLDPVRSTYAGARYLRDLYERFGSWDLTFAAYNMGYGRLASAIRKFNSNDYWLLSHLEAGLPFETSIYVAKITAIAIVANNPERFEFGDLTREPTTELSEIDVPPGTPLRPVAAAAGMDVEALKALNPHLKKSRVPPGTEPVHVYIPRASYERFAERWSKNHEPAQTVSYVLRFGETLEDVARRYRMPPARLREMNELDESTIVAAGFPIVVPAVGEVPTLNGEKLVATVPDKDFHYENRRRIFYRVAQNDTPEAVARFFDVTVDELVAWNHVTEHGFLQRDMLLQLFVRPELDLGRAVVLAPDQVQILTVGSDEFFDFHEGQRGRVRVRYRVQPKDTLAKIAERFELSVGSVGRINQFGSNKELKPDDWIIVYVPEKSLPELERKGIAARITPAKGDTKLASAPAPKPAAPPAEDPTMPGLPPENAGPSQADELDEERARAEVPSQPADVASSDVEPVAAPDAPPADERAPSEPTPAAAGSGSKSAP